MIHYQKFKNMKQITITKPSGIWTCIAHHIVNSIKYYEAQKRSTDDPKLKQTYADLIKYAEREYEELMGHVREH